VVSSNDLDLHGERDGDQYRTLEGDADPEEEGPESCLDRSGRSGMPTRRSGIPRTSGAKHPSRGIAPPG
jgi:hypothetical protein